MAKLSLLTKLKESLFGKLKQSEGKILEEQAHLHEGNLRMDAENTRLQDALDHCNRRISVNRDELETLQKNVDSLNSEIAKLRKENENLRLDRTADGEEPSRTMRIPEKIDLILSCINELRELVVEKSGNADQMISQLLSRSIPLIDLKSTSVCDEKSEDVSGNQVPPSPPQPNNAMYAQIYLPPPTTTYGGHGNQPSQSLEKSIEPERSEAKLELTPNEREIASAYNKKQNLDQFTTEVNPTDDSMNDRRAGSPQPPIFEATRRGSYHIITIQDQKYLVPKYDMKITEFTLQSLQILFDCQGISSDSDSFILVKPGRVESLEQGKWQLVEPGILQSKSI